MKAFLESSKQTLARLGTDAGHGLTPQQCEENAQKYGKNAFTKEKGKPFLLKVLEAMREPMTIILLIAGAVSLGVNFVRLATGAPTEFVECIGVFFAIFLSVAITVGMEGRSAKAFEALNKIQDNTEAKVLRDGKLQMILQQDLVVGDILYIETGNKIPVDARLLESTGLRVDESSLTGESQAVKKDADVVFDNDRTPVAERSNMIYSGSYVTGGSGCAVVSDVGDHTEFGKIAAELSGTDTSATPLQEKLAKLGKVIAVLGSVIAAGIFLIQLFRLIGAGTATFANISETFITSIALIVAAVPEGLPTIVAIALAVNVIKMSKQNALVKKMVACETIGSVNVICSDKTGTLTENRMTVTELYTGGEVLRPDQLPDGAMLSNFCINSTADVDFDGDGPSFIGNPTECALIVSAHKSGYDYQTIRTAADVAHSYPFSSETKNMTTVIRSNGRYTAYTKGSPEKIIDMCSTLDADSYRAIQDKIIEYQERAYRVIAFAHKEFDTETDFEQNRHQVESGMTYDGFVAITDPLRADVYDAVAKCRKAGIDLKMLTGDNIVTAVAIATELDILDKDHIAIEAGDLEQLSEAEFIKLLPKIRVIARSTPIIKMRVVNGLKSLGNVVAVTGDGINDAPAIKNADVGVAMGITGTEVSKEASDIILLDDSFSTIVRAVHWGRGIYENFQRFIQFQLTVNLSSVLFVLASVLIGFASPFSALELLWINLIMDGPPALTLGLEPIRDGLMQRKPTPRDRSIVTKTMLGKIVFNGLFMVVVMLSQLELNFLGGTPEQMNTILFTLFVVFQLFNAFNSRELTNTSIFKNIASNRSMLLVFAGTFLLQVVITQFGGFLFGTVPLPLTLWVKIIGAGFSIILVSELFKLAARLFTKKEA